jgi:hypothetical protein
MLAVTLSPVRLTPFGLRSDRLVIRDASAPNGAPLMILSDVRVPVSPSLFRGAPLRASIGTEGSVSGFMAWDGSDITVDQLSARLEDFPIAGALPGVSAKGKVTLSAQFHPPPARPGAKAEIPEGEIRGKLEAVEISGLSAAGVSLPVTRLQDVDISVKTGRVVQIDRFETRGDVAGTVKGTITPNADRPQDSRLALTVATTLRQGWIQEAGVLRPILEGFFPGGRVEGTLNGTLGVPNWSPTRGAR